MIIPQLNKIYPGDCLKTMKTWPDSFIQCCITSPPYWGLRDYGVEGQAGLEYSPEEFVTKMVDIFREVGRVLRNDGTLWLNLGDSYSQGSSGIGGTSSFQGSNSGSFFKRPSLDSGRPPKNLLGIPWRVALALQADVWILRSDIIWAKPNPMPESVTDRPTKSHEYIFLMTKTDKYFYDAEAIKEPVSQVSLDRAKYGWDCDRPSTKNASNGGPGIHVDEMGSRFVDPSGRNKRSVWTVPVTGYNDAHFATFPENLIKPCVLAGCPTNGIVLDPFMGAGTTALVASKYNRRFIGCELNPEYIRLAENRIASEIAQGKLF